MPDKELPATIVATVGSRSIVSLKTTPGLAGKVAERMSLADTLRVRISDVISFWVSPGCWMLLSDTTSAASLIDECTSSLQDILHLAVDYSDGMTIVSVEGPLATEVLASGCGLDLRSGRYPPGRCCRTRFAQVAAFVVAVSKQHFELYVDRSYESYICRWLVDSSRVAAHCRKISQG